MARQVALHPDSPASLAILSSVSAAMRPRQQSVDQLVLALVDQAERPGAGTDAAVSASIKHWETVCEATVDAGLMAAFRKTATELLERRRRQPPRLESIVAGVEDRSDVGYDLGVSLEGLRGTWHRLWAAVSMSKSFGDEQEQLDCVREIREQFERALGRPLADDEWRQLEQHAHRHAETVMKPMMDAQDAKRGDGSRA